MKLFEKESLKLEWKVFEKFVAKSLTKYNGLDNILRIEEKLLTFFISMATTMKQMLN